MLIQPFFFTETCSADVGLDKSTYTVDFTKGASDDWNVTYGTVTYDDSNGAVYTISKSGDAPTVQSNFYVFFASVSVVMKTAPGTGIISCAILESDDLDEIDWEWLGGTPAQVETNYFGKGNTSTWDRETYVDMANAQADFHNYTIVWTKESTIWMIDGSTVRTLAYADADSYPQTPMRVKLGTWAGGDSTNSAGTIEWSGGATDYADGPFTAYIKSVSITNYNPASNYTYSDMTGTYSSIKIGSSDSDSDSDSDGSTETSSSVQTGASSTAISIISSSLPGALTATSTSTAAATGNISSSGTLGPAYRNGTNSTTPAGNSTSSSTSSSSSGSPSSSSDSSSSTSSSSSAIASSDAPTRRGGLLGTSVLLGFLGCALVLA